MATHICKDIIMASYCGHHKCLIDLLDKGADISKKDGNGMMAVHHVSRHGYVNCLMTLLDGGIDVDVETAHSGLTPLHFASEYGHDECVKILLDTRRESKAKGADINAQRIVDGSRSVTPLHLASIRGRISTIKILLDTRRESKARGADINIKGRQGWTALHFSSKYGQNECITTLLERGADLNAKSDLGKTPLDVVHCDSEDFFNKYIEDNSALIKEPDCD